MRPRVIPDFVASPRRRLQHSRQSFGILATYKKRRLRAKPIEQLQQLRRPLARSIVKRQCHPPATPIPMPNRWREHLRPFPAYRPRRRRNTGNRARPNHGLSAQAML